MPIILAVVQVAHVAAVALATIPTGGRSTLTLGGAQIAALHDLRERAAAAPIHMPDVMARNKTPEGLREHVAAMQALTIAIPHLYLVTFAIETGHPAGPCRHLTMSVANDTPTEAAAMLVARELGFVGDISAIHFWLEPACPLHRDQGRAQVANLIQPLSATHAPGKA
jgi:hypothetical protein